MLEANVNGRVTVNGRKYAVVDIRCPNAGDMFLDTSGGVQIDALIPLHSPRVILREITPNMVTMVIPLDRNDVTDGTKFSCGHDRDPAFDAIAFGDGVLLVNLGATSKARQITARTFTELKDLGWVYKPGGVGDWIRCEKAVEVEGPQ